MGRDKLRLNDRNRLGVVYEIPKEKLLTYLDDVLISLLSKDIEKEKVQTSIHKTNKKLNIKVSLAYSKETCAFLVSYMTGNGAESIGLIILVYDLINHVYVDRYNTEYIPQFSDRFVLLMKLKNT